MPINGFMRFISTEPSYNSEEKSSLTLTNGESSGISSFC